MKPLTIRLLITINLHVVRRQYFLRRSLLLVLLGCCLLPTGTRAQSDKADSLRTLLAGFLPDSQRAECLLVLSKELEQREVAKSLDYAFRALSLAQAHELPRLVLRANMQMAAVLFYSGAFDAAVIYFTRARQQATALDDRPALLAARFNLLSVRLLNPVNDADLEMELWQLLRLAEETIAVSGDSTLAPRFLPGIYNNLGMVLQSKGDLAAAEKQLMKGLAVTRLYPSAENYRLQLLNVHSLLLLEMARPEASLAIAKEAREASRQSGMTALEASSLLHMALASKALRDTAAAISLMTEAYGLSQVAGHTPLSSVLAADIANCYDALGDEDKALRYHLLTKEFNQQSALVKAEAELERTELLDQLGQLEASLLAEQSASQYRIFLLLGLFLLSALGVFLVWVTLQKKYRLAQLDKMDLELDAKRLGLQADFLQSELDKRDKQLASEALYRLKNNEVVRETVQQLLSLHRMSNREVRESILRAVRGLESTLDKQVWEAFDIRFQQVHQGFFDRLQQAFPSLTANERRLCAFLKLNMSTKEIAAVTTQSTNSIYVARTRLRRKLGLQEEEDAGLVSFLAKF
ncbi:MAG: hypothetical protein RLY31_2895 [Bacteroidota bacterium]